MIKVPHDKASIEESPDGSPRCGRADVVEDGGPVPEVGGAAEARDGRLVAAVADAAPPARPGAAAASFAAAAAEAVAVRLQPRVPVVVRGIAGWRGGRDRYCAFDGIGAFCIPKKIQGKDDSPFHSVFYACFRELM